MLFYNTCTHIISKVCMAVVLLCADGHPILVTGSTLGHIALWNLEERRLQSQMREAHNGGVTSLYCLPSEPLMVTSSPDNSLKVWHA